MNPDARNHAYENDQVESRIKCMKLTFEFRAENADRERKREPVLVIKERSKGRSKRESESA